MAETTVSTLGKLVPTEVLQEARLAFQKSADIVPLVNVADISGVPGATADFPIHTTVAVTVPGSETTDVTTNSAIQPTFATLTVARRTVRVDISDLSQAAARAGFTPNEMAGRLIGQARAKKVETDILACMTTNYTSSVGSTSSTTIAMENVLASKLKLKNNEADDNLVLSLHANQEAHLLDDIVVTSSSDSDRSQIAQDAQVSGSIDKKTLLGFRVVSSMRVSTGTDTNDIYLGMAFNGLELGYAVKNIGDNGGLEIQRDASKGLNEVVMNYYDSAGRIRAAAFVLVKSQTYAA